MEFYRATGGGTAWTGRNWGSDEPLGTWQYVTTNADGRVTKLWLSRPNLSGSLPSSLGNLTYLEALVVFEPNDLNGSLPSSLGNLTNLERLILSYTNLSGSIPSELSNHWC